MGLDPAALLVDFAPSGSGPTLRPMTEWAQMKARAIELRRAGLSYEEIAEQVGSDRYGTTPWGVYKWCHPEKTGEQIKAWMDKHHPDQHTWVLESLAKHNPEALARMNRELEIARTKGLL
jgi:ribosomal protein S12 methylthiotransferase accessory factor YcaO